VGTPFSALPAECRPRERLASSGPSSLSEVELLALQLRSGSRSASASDLAADVLAQFGGLDRLSTARVEELAAVPGVGPAKAASIVAGFELARRGACRMNPKTTLRTAADVAAAAGPRLSGLRREHMLVFACDRLGRVLQTVTLSEGSADRSLLPVREVLNAVLRHDGSAFAVAHNHPSGDPEPSQADVASTANLADGAKAVGLRFLGHVVVADGCWSEVAIRPSRRTTS
jgi:DNA repair protein RadC